MREVGAFLRFDRSEAGDDLSGTWKAASEVVVGNLRGPNKSLTEILVYKL